MKAPITSGWLRGVGFLLLILGFGWLTASVLLRNYNPLRWGGPDIGGGALVLLAGVAVVAGLVLVVVDIPLHRRDRGSRLPVMTWIAAFVSVLLAATFVEVLVLKPGDPSAGLNGQVGVTVSASGWPRAGAGDLPRIHPGRPHRRPESGVGPE